MLSSITLGEDEQSVDTVFCEVSVGSLETVHSCMMYVCSVKRKHKKTNPLRAEARNGCLSGRWHRLLKDHRGLLSEVNALLLENPLDVALVVEEGGELGLFGINLALTERSGYESKLVTKR